MAITTRVDGQKIRAARLKAGYSQSQLARAIGVAEKNIIRWESGENQPRIESIAALARATGQGLAYFLTAADDDEEEDGLPSLDDLLRRRISQIVREETETPA